MIEWLRSEIDFAKTAFARAERDKCWGDTAALGSRIGTLREVLHRLEREEADRGTQATHGMSQS